ncbi:MAG: hypothetical protein ACQETH_03890 [Candidatus Rifleibacteriota bacterium]
MGRRKKHKFNKESSLGEIGDFIASVWGFIFDGLKIIFKLKPDDDQTMHDFVFEKLGAMALLLTCIAILGGVIVAILFEASSESHYGYY